jgi:two-component system, cell cycle sensor histidine kinase and response regulator CckA
VNEWLCVKSGFNLDELIGKPVRSFYESEEDYERVGEVLYRTGEAETKLVKKDGTTMDVHLRASPTDSYSYVVTVEDITAQKQTLNMLLLTQFSVENAFDAIVWLDKEGRIIYANEVACTSIGYSRQELSTMTFFDISPQLGHDQWEKDLEICRIKGGVFYESMSLHKDGKSHPIELSHSFIQFDGQEYIVSIMRDISERKRSEDVLRGEAAFLEALTDSSFDGILVSGGDWKASFFNRKTVELWKIPESVLEERIEGGWINHISRMVKNKKQFTEQITFLQENPHEILHDELELVDGTVLERYSCGVFGKDGTCFGRVWTFRDITERKQSEEENLRLQSQLRQSQKMEAIGTLAGGIAHDFNNILTVLTGYGTLLQMKINKDEHLRAYADQLLASATKASTLIQSLLAFSRQQPVNLVSADIGMIVKGTEKLLGRLLTEDISLTTSIAKENQTALVDVSQVDQILFNLVANARDAMPSGGSITIETKLVDVDDDFRRVHGFGKPGKYVLLSVSDTGIGMTDEVKDSIFVPFFTTKGVGKGTGLGLSTVYGIIKQHNGYVTLYSEPGMGTCFNLYFPVSEDSPQPREFESKPVQRGTETVLVAEDNDEVRTLVKEILIEWGYSVIMARDGEEAVKLFRSHQGISLLILDSVMPKRNGREAYEAIRWIDPSIKVIFMSGYTKDVVLDKGIEEKKFEFLAKPLQRNRLLEKVREVLDRP